MRIAFSLVIQTMYVTVTNCVIDIVPKRVLGNFYFLTETSYTDETWWVYQIDYTEKNGKKIGLWRHLVVKNENRDLNGFEYRKCIKMEIRVTNRIRCVWSTIFH